MSLPVFSPFAESVLLVLEHRYTLSLTGDRNDGLTEEAITEQLLNYTNVIVIA